MGATRDDTVEVGTDLGFCLLETEQHSRPSSAMITVVQAVLAVNDWEPPIVGSLEPLQIP